MKRDFPRSIIVLEDTLEQFVASLENWAIRIILLEKKNMDKLLLFSYKIWIILNIIYRICLLIFFDYD